MTGPIWPTPADYDRTAERALRGLSARGIEARIVGSYADGRLSPPYSDLDVLSVAAPGQGAAVRDAVIDVARSLDDVLGVTIDPFDRQAIVYSIHATGLQVDWFIVERSGGEERPVWRGERPQPIDLACRAWSSLLYTLSLLIRSDDAESRRLTARDLAEHWVWLSANGVDVSPLLPYVPSANDDLRRLIAETADVLPPHDQLSRILHSRLDA